MVLVSLSVVGGLLFLALWARLNEKLWRDWEVLLRPSEQKMYHAMEQQLDSGLAMADYAYDRADRERQVGSVDEAVRLVSVGYEMMAQVAPDLKRLLAGMAVFSRMVSAMMPVPPLRPRDFHLAQLMSLAFLNQVLHRLLVTTAERFRLRLYVIGQGIGIVVRFLAGSTDRIRNAPSTTGPEWDEIALLRRDFRTLTTETLQSFRLLLTSVSSESRRGRLAAR